VVPFFSGSFASRKNAAKEEEENFFFAFCVFIGIYGTSSGEGWEILHNNFYPDSHYFRGHKFSAQLDGRKSRICPADFATEVAFWRTPNEPERKF
jgi:hypothetical protein